MPLTHSTIQLSLSVSPQVAADIPVEPIPAPEPEELPPEPILDAEPPTLEPSTEEPPTLEMPSPAFSPPSEPVKTLELFEDDQASAELA